jgi:hypothetical protein
MRNNVVIAFAIVVVTLVFVTIIIPLPVNEKGQLGVGEDRLEIYKYGQWVTAIQPHNVIVDVFDHEPPKNGSKPVYIRHDDGVSKLKPFTFFTTLKSEEFFKLEWDVDMDLFGDEQVEVTTVIFNSEAQYERFMSGGMRLDAGVKPYYLSHLSSGEYEELAGDAKEDVLYYYMVIYTNSTKLSEGFASLQVEYARYDLSNPLVHCLPTESCDLPTVNVSLSDLKFVLHLPEKFDTRNYRMGFVRNNKRYWIVYMIALCFSLVGGSIIGGLIAIFSSRMFRRRPRLFPRSLSEYHPILTE